MKSTHHIIAFALAMTPLLGCSDETNSTNSVIKKEDMSMTTMAKDMAVGVDMKVTEKDMAKGVDMAKETDMARMTDMAKGVDMAKETDMRNATLPDRYAGAKVAACNAASVKECTANADCQADERCEDISDDPIREVACCVKGERGPVPTASTCQAIETKIECEEALCIRRNAGPYYCTKRCMNDTDCLAPITKCNPVLGVCTDVDP